MTPASSFRRWRQPRPSPIEIAFWEQARPRIPDLQREVHIGRYRVDFLVPDARLIIELYGYKWHSGQEKRIQDAARERELGRMGYQVMHFMGAEVTRDVDACVAEVLARLHRSGPARQVTTLPSDGAVSMPKVTLSRAPVVHSHIETPPIVHIVAVASPIARNKPRNDARQSLIRLKAWQAWILGSLGILVVLASVALASLVGATMLATF